MNKEKPLISIIVPVYNVESYLEQCLDSIVNQKCEDVEIIIINDGSTDSSLKIMEEYKSKHDNITIYSRENKGLLYTRVEGVKKSNGRYIMFVDSDDWIESNALMVLKNEILKADYDIVRANYNIATEDGIYEIKNLKTDVIYNSQLNKKLYKNFMNTDFFNNVWGQLIKKDIIDTDDIDTSISMGEDIVFNLACYKNISTMKTIDKMVYNYRQNSSSITKTESIERLTNNIKDLFKVYRKMTRDI